MNEWERHLVSLPEGSVHVDVNWVTEAIYPFAATGKEGESIELTNDLIDRARASIRTWMQVDDPTWGR